jgi:hypothetical protein
MPPITSTRPAVPDRRLKVAHLEDATSDAGRVAAHEGQDLPHDPKDLVLQAIARGARPRELIRIVMHELAKDAARVEWIAMHPTAFPPEVMVEFGRMAGRRQRILRGLVTAALRDLDREQGEAPVPPEIVDRLREMFVTKVLESARAVCTPEDAERFEAKLREKMAG